MLRHYFFLSILAVASGSYWKCDNPDPLFLDLTNGPVTIPSNLTTLQYGGQMSCNWRTNDIGPGMYFSVEINANFGISDQFFIGNPNSSTHDYNGDKNDIPRNFTGTLYFPPGNIIISLNSRTNSTDNYLSLKLRQNKSPTLPHTEYVLGSGQVVISLMDFQKKTYGFKSDSEYVFRLATESDDVRYSSCFMFSTQNYLAGLDEQIDGIPTRFTHTTSITCLSQDFPKAYLIVAILPKSIHPQSSWSVKLENEGDMYTNNWYSYNLTSNGTYPSYLTTYCPTTLCRDILYIAKPNKDNLTLQLYSGSLAPVRDGEVRSLQPLENIPLNYQPENIYLPQQMCAEWSTYSITQGSAQLTISPMDTDCTGGSWTYSNYVRRGFVVSPYYGFMKSNTSVTTTFNSGGVLIRYFYNWPLSSSIMDPVNVVISRYQNTIVSSKTISASDAGQNFSSVGIFMTVTFAPPAEGSYGSIIFFEMEKSASIGGYISTMLVLCFFLA